MEKLEKLNSLKTDDYQNRNGNYPKSNIPDTIDVFKNEIIASFKNTDEKTAEKWLKRYLVNQNLEVISIETEQTGDYHDDWVEAYATVKI